MNVNYLVQKFQKILQAAPAMAFDLALSTLCQQCSNIMKGLEALANDLNHLQMNECHDAKVLAAQIVSPFTDNPKIEAEAQQNYSLVTGIQNMYTDIQKQVLSNNGQPSLSNESGMYSGCPADIVNLFMTQGQSVFSAVAANRGIPTSHVELVRGLVGDLQFDPITDSSGNTTFHLTQVIPCQENSAYGLDSLLDGSAYVRPLSAPDAACVPISDTNANLIQWAQNRVDSVYQNLLTQGTLSSDDQAFINTVPLVYHNLALRRRHEAGAGGRVRSRRVRREGLCPFPGQGPLYRGDVQHPPRPDGPEETGQQPQVELPDLVHLARRGVSQGTRRPHQADGLHPSGGLQEVSHGA